jgi:hypothetical protein
MIAAAAAAVVGDHSTDELVDVDDGMDPSSMHQEQAQQQPPDGPPSGPPPMYYQYPPSHHHHHMGYPPPPPPPPHHHHHHAGYMMDPMYGAPTTVVVSHQYPQAMHHHHIMQPPPPPQAPQQQQHLRGSSRSGHLDAAAAGKIPKYKKAPDAPKRFKSAFIIFSAEKHRVIKESLAEEGRSEKVGEICASAVWKSCPEFSLLCLLFQCRLQTLPKWSVRHGEN